MAEEEKVPRNYKVAIPCVFFFVLSMVIYYYALHPETLALVFFGILMGFLWAFVFLGWSYAGDKSKLYGLKVVTDRLPAVKKPDGHVVFKKKMLWTALILILYFVMTNVMLFGLDQKKTIDLFASWRVIMAGAQGSLMHLGIGPIVTGSIIMQLFTGAKIISLDLSKSEDKAVYQSTQKLIVIAMIFVEAIPQVYGYLTPSHSLVEALNGWSGGNGQTIAQAIIVIQLVFGSYLVFLMDEVVSKWGIGSGISLFIAAGVAEAIFTGTINWLPVKATESLSLSNPPAGTIPKTIYMLQNMSAGELANGGFEQIFLAHPNPVIALIGTIGIFFVVAYVESTRLELPLAHGRARGARGRYPIRLMYASNIPVILMSALLANIAMFSMLLWSHPTLSQIPYLGHQWWIGAYPTPEQAEQLGISQSTAISGGAYYLSTVNGLHEWLLPLFNPQRYEGYMRGHTYWQVLAHVIVFFSVMVIGSIFFAKFWIETTNMNSKAVAEQIERQGMQIPGFRRDPRILERVLDRYIPYVTIFSGAAVGALAAVADMIGTVGNASGTGVLLTVGIMINLYEAMAREQLMEMHPLLRGFFGE
ncbi:MAG: preprotein translocase subunit SecY [Thermoplasmata archaeon]